MRTQTAQDTALLAAGFGAQTVWCRVEVDRDGLGSWVDLSDWNGIDFVRAVQYGENIDAPAWSATVTLAAWAADNPAISLSPLMTNSLLNSGGALCKPFNKIRISTSVVPLDDQAATYNKVFQGRIDRWQVKEGLLSLECRDEIALLQDRFIETSQNYGSENPSVAAAADIEEVIQNILDDHINTTKSAARTSPLSSRSTLGDPWQLYGPNGTAAAPYPVADNTGAAVRLYPQEKMPIYDAINANAQCIAYRLRMRWHDGASIDDFVLVLEEPDRAATSAVLTLDPTASQARIIDASLDIQNVRNAVIIGFQEQGGAQRFYITTDPTSIASFGRRPIELMLGATSQVDTTAEATKMGDGILNDLKDPTATVNVSAPYLWYVQLGDLVAIEADGIHFDAQQKLAVRSRVNTIAQGGAARTDLVLHGKPQSGVTTHVAAHRQFINPEPLSLSVPFTWGGSLHPNGNFADDRG